MLALIVSTTIMCSVTACFYLYRQLSCKQAILSTIEMDVAQAMLPRSHKLCERACEIDIIPDVTARTQADEQFRDDVHQYMADFEEEVAARLKGNANLAIKSYGGIRINP
ncbi:MULTISPECIES: hypothetical protein [Alkalimonas]|uniref:Uncharacterized protein n=1 Tax=Alkalimonas mucilaginosa TaxID=3057676 RepID=A0ABU7JC72_9GAMM|nr:hypothetical protein [Alkalimonas sp. MEB004]MEE2023297.1 hypothetical protein [Alkalimonas sp. MEB004]